MGIVTWLPKRTRKAMLARVVSEKLLALLPDLASMDQPRQGHALRECRLIAQAMRETATELGLPTATET